jgi:hypothetical protein
MTGRRTFIISILFLLLIIGNSYAITLTASVDKQEVALGEQITLRVNVVSQSGSVSDPTLPDLSAFEVYSAGRSQNIAINNGVMAASLNITYILVPKKPGDFIIGPLVLRDQTGMSSTEPIKIKVKPQQSSGSVTPTQPGQAPAKNIQSPQKGGDFFIDQVVDKSNPYVGEQVTLTFRFYQALNLWGQPTLEWPKYSGFTIEDLQPNARYYQVVNGRRYLVTEIKRALFPISAGKVKIDSPELTIKPDDFGMAFDPFSFFDRDMRDLFKRGEPKVLTTDPVYLNVRPLPDAGRPTDFDGAVGNYAIRMSIDKDSVGVDEPITMNVVLSGTGNIRSLPALKFPELSDFRIYDSGSTESVSNTGAQISGAKTYEQAVIPKTSGIFTIPPLAFSYFDAASGQYKTLSTKAQKITATGEGLADVGGAPKNIIGSGKLSLGYIITDFPKKHSQFDLAGSFWFWLLQAIPLGGLVAAVVYRIKLQKMLGDQGYARRAGAGKRLKSIFKTAVALKAKGDIAGFYAALYDAVLGYVADRLNLSKAGMTLDELRENASIPDEIKTEIVAFLESCQTARFAPRGLESNHAENLLSQAGDLIVRLERAV